jgi:PPP family 3-phenylpropionic acid transporter
VKSSAEKSSQKFFVASQYFIYFGVLGAFLPYFNLYCYHLGFSGFQIGTISALRSMTLVVFPILWGILADRWQCRRAIYIACTIVSAAIWSGYLATTDFELMLIITFAYAVFHSPVISFLEAVTMETLGTEKKSYGRLRVWGSISFITVVVGLGRIIDLFSVDIILVLILAGSALLAVASFKLPRPEKQDFDRFGSGFGAFMTLRIQLFLFCAFLMLVSHGAYYGFFSIHLENLGYGSTFIGLAWALASAAEITVMLQSDRIFKRFPLERVLVFSFCVAAARWLVLFWAASPAVIMASQLLHAVTYGTFHVASILYIDRLSPVANKTLGQALNNALTYGLGLMTGFFLNGYLYERMSSHGLFLVSGLIALAGGVLFKGLQPGRKE